MTDIGAWTNLKSDNIAEIIHAGPLNNLIPFMVDHRWGVHGDLCGPMDYYNISGVHNIWIEYMHMTLVGVRDGVISAQVSDSNPSLKAECWIQTRVLRLNRLARKPIP